MLERVWRKENPLHYWWEYKLTQPPWRTIWRFLKKLGIKIQYYTVIPLWRLIEKTHVPPMFIAALFITARTWKQPRCPSADEWMKKLWYIHTMEYY